MKLRDFFDAFSHLKRQNPWIRGLQNFYRDQADFVRLVAASPSPVLFLSGSDAVITDGRQANRFTGLDAVATIQTNRPPRYLHDQFDTAEALGLPPSEQFYLVFANKPPPALQEMFDGQFGKGGEDYICIYFMPPHYDWTVGKRMPLLPFVLPIGRLKERGLSLKDLDFDRATFIGQDAAQHNFATTGRLQELIEPGLHIPFEEGRLAADEEMKELFLPLSHLQRIQRTLVNLYDTSVGLSDPQNFEELQSRVSQLSEDIVAMNFENTSEAEEFGSSLSIMISELLLSPAWIPSEERARNLQMSSRGPTSTLTRAAIRAPETSELIQVARLTKEVLFRARRSSHSKLRREKEKTLAEDQSEYGKAIDGFLKLQSEMSRERAQLDDKGFFHLRNEVVKSEPLSIEMKTPTRWQSIRHSVTSKLRKTLFVASLVAAPVALALSRGLGDILIQEGHRILPYAATASVFASFTAVAISFYSYLRNATIRDARVSGEFYKDLDPETAKLLQEAQEESEEDDVKTLKLEQDILSEGISQNPWSPGSLARRFKRFSLKLWYGYETLEERSEKMRNSETGDTQLSALQLFGVCSVRVLRHVFYLPLQRGFVSAIFPFYLQTRALGGRAKLDTWRDRAWWPSFLYYPFVATTYTRGAASRFLHKSTQKFHPDDYWRTKDAERLKLIEASALVEKAASRAAKRLEIAKALELGVSSELIVSILAVERHLHEEGEAWWQRLMRRLPEEQRIDIKIYKEIVAYGKEVVRLSRGSEIFSSEFPEAEKFVSDTTDSSAVSMERFVEAMSKRAESKIIEQMKEKQKPNEPPYYQSAVSVFRSSISHFLHNQHETFYRIGKSGENVTPSRSVLNLGAYPKIYLQDQLIVTAQVVPMMLASGLDVGMSDEELFNGMAPVFLFLPSFLSSYGNSLTARSRLIESLVDPKNSATQNSYFVNLYKNSSTLPWKSIGLQSASLFDLRILAQVMSGLMMVGLVVPVDLTITTLSAQSPSSLGVMPIAEKLAGRFANAVAGVSFNLSFSFFSSPLYTTVLALRRSSGGIRHRGYVPAPLRNTKDPHQGADTFAYAGFNAVINSLYGYLSGQVIPSWSEGVMIGVDQGIPEAVEHLMAPRDLEDLISSLESCRENLQLASSF